MTARTSTALPTSPPLEASRAKGARYEKTHASLLRERFSDNQAGMRRTILQTILTATGALLLSACGPAVGVSQMGSPRPANQPNCALEFVTVTPADMAPSAKFGPNGAYEMVGVVSIGARSGTAAMSEEIRQIVRPRACGIGGEAVSLMVSGGDSNAYGNPQQSMVFQVWAHRVAAPTQPQAF